MSYTMAVDKRVAEVAADIIDIVQDRIGVRLSFKELLPLIFVNDDEIANIIIKNLSEKAKRVSGDIKIE